MFIDNFLEYLSLEKKYSRNTIIAYQKDILSFQNFCTEHFGDDAPDKVSYLQVRQWIIFLVDEGISNRSVNRKVASVKSYFKFLMKCGLIETNPLLKHKALKTDKKAEIPFSEEEMKRVLGFLKSNNDFISVRNSLIVELFYATGIRRSELIHLKCTDVDLSQKVIKVLGKRQKERIVPLVKTVVNDLTVYLDLRKAVVTDDSGDFLFLRKNGNKIYETLVYRIINNYFSKASTKAKTSPHVLRHTFATHMLSQGADLNSVKELLGHSSLASTQVYTHNSIAELKKVHGRAHPRSLNNLDD